MTYSKFHFHTVFTDAADQLAPAKTSSISIRVNLFFLLSLDHTADIKSREGCLPTEKVGKDREEG